MIEIASVNQITDADYEFVRVGVVEATKNTVTGHTIWTFLLTYPRLMHSEFMTHHAISKCASSSRAVPIKKSIAAVWSNPVVPYHWGAHQPGMQANFELTGLKKSVAKFIWKTSAKFACVAAWMLDKLGAHKQWVNRILEPYLTITVVATATELDNFYALRAHPDAQPEFYRLATLMRSVQGIVQPREVSPAMGNAAWHLPFVTAEERENSDHEILPKLSAARCARTSYLNHDKQQPSKVGDLVLFNRLITSEPEHASPTEHQAFPCSTRGPSYSLLGWRSQRYIRDTERRLAKYKDEPQAE